MIDLDLGGASPEEIRDYLGREGWVLYAQNRLRAAIRGPLMNLGNPVRISPSTRDLRRRQGKDAPGADFAA